MHTRRSVLGTACSMLLLALQATAARAQKTYRIGFLTPRATPAPGQPDAFSQAFVAGLRERGLVLGQNLAIEWRYADGRYERLPELAAELVRQQPDAIAVYGTAAAQALSRATSTVPIVITAAVDPVGSKLVQSLAQPGGNVTGLSAIGGDLSPKHLELLKSALPAIRTVALLGNPDNSAHAAIQRNAQAGAEQLGLRLHALAARTSAEVDAAFADMAGKRADACVVATDAFFSGLGHQLARLSVRHRIPTISIYREHVLAGGLISYGQDIAAFHTLAATYVDKVLKGTRPADLPMEQPTRIELLVNRATARKLKLTLSQETLLRADRVID